MHQRYSGFSSIMAGVPLAAICLVFSPLNASGQELWFQSSDEPESIQVTLSDAAHSNIASEEFRSAHSLHVPQAANPPTPVDARQNLWFIDEQAESEKVDNKAFNSMHSGEGGPSKPWPLAAAQTASTGRLLPKDRQKQHVAGAVEAFGISNQHVAEAVEAFGISKQHVAEAVEAFGISKQSVAEAAEAFGISFSVNKSLTESTSASPSSTASSGVPSSGTEKETPTGGLRAENAATDGELVVTAREILPANAFQVSTQPPLSPSLSQDLGESRMLDVEAMIGSTIDPSELFRSLDVADNYESVAVVERTGVRRDSNLQLWYGKSFSWITPVFYHEPLYFEQPNLERYGNGTFHGLQPFASSAHFFGTIPLIPAKLMLQRPFERVYTLGNLRPGNCVPKQRHWPLH